MARLMRAPSAATAKPRARLAAGLLAVGLLAAASFAGTAGDGADPTGPGEAVGGKAAELPALGADIDPPETWTETIKVELEKRDQPKHRTLRFLEENRDFFRARLDQLLVRLERDRDGKAKPLDPRWLMYRDMMADIRAARDSAEVSEEWIRRRELLESVGDLVGLETEMDEMEMLLSQQRHRLVALEEDFTDRQTTALVVLMKGIPATGTPAAIVLSEDDGSTVRIALDEATREALARGGSAEILHEFVEPRELTFAVVFEGPSWTGRPPYEITLAPERDRLTFLEIDAGGLDPAATSSSLAARSWTR
jgi:hypothetical protein